MATALFDKLGRALEKVKRPGSFCVGGDIPAILPGLEVEGLGPVGLPLTVPQAEALRALCEQAPYGRGERTLVDTDVRRVSRLAPSRFALRNPAWDAFLDSTLELVRDELGLKDEALRCQLHDLLLYEPGGFFLPHRDGEKLDRMVATLVVVLPSPHEGGELVVRHDGRECTFDFGADDAASPYRVRYAAFYADCEHEVRPVRSGCRLCLVYNLALARSGRPVAAPRASEHVEAVAKLLRSWAKADAGDKLVVTLEHQYTRDGIAWDALKGVDRARADVLRLAAEEAECRAYLGLLTFHESGSAEYVEDRRGRRRNYYDEDDAENYEMGEVFEANMDLDDLVDPAGARLPVDGLPVGEDELLDPEALTDVDPEEEFEGYTGNAGMTIDRWYRHAAIVLWPEGRHFEMACGPDSRAATPELARLVGLWQEAREPDEKSERERQCLGLASAIVARWPVEQAHHFYLPSPSADELLVALEALGAVDLVRAFLRDVMARDPSVEPGPALASACRGAGWPAFEAELAAVVRATTHTSAGRNVRLLELVCNVEGPRKAGKAGPCVGLADALIEAIEALDGGPKRPDWQTPRVDRAAILGGLARSLLAAGRAEALGRFVDHAWDRPDLYPLHEAHLAALDRLRPWLRTRRIQPAGPLVAWAARCREELEALTAAEPAPSPDLRRPAPISCRCADCAELKTFLADPVEATHLFRVREDRRQHLAGKIEDNGIDLDVKVLETGRPYALVCTKNTATYEANLAAYRRNLEHLEAVRAIESGRP